MAETIVLRVQSREGTKRVECKTSDNVDNLLSAVANVFQLSEDGKDWKLYKDRTKKQQLKTGQSLTVQKTGVRHGDMLYLDTTSAAAQQDDAASTGSRSGASLSTTNGNTMPRARSSSVMMTEDGLDEARGSPGNINSAARTSSGGVFPAMPPGFAGQLRTRNESTASFASQHETQMMPYSVEANSAAQEDEVDLLLEKQDGRIERGRDERRCRHGPNGRCLYCTPLEPFDEEYLKSRQPPIKHMSFHSHIRKLQSGTDKGKFIALREPTLRIKPGCSEHQPWPEGICTRCQPRPLTLNRQTYRHVDNILFENTQIVDRFLEYWRKTGEQRIGFLYGTYEQHKDVPLGIRARIVAIYEPPQTNASNAVELSDDPYADAVDAFASRLGIQRVGWIFTDLEPLDPRAGTVKHVRGKDTYFLTAEECLQAGYFQCRNPNPCRLSAQGFFGSKFVTVVCTGDEQNQIHLEGYQVSNQCSALVRDTCVVPTIDSPELGYVKESSMQQYVPDVLYKEKDAYGNEITKLARPFPVEYLMIDVPASSAKEQQYTFELPNVDQFPTENREHTKFARQTLAEVRKYLGQFSPGNRPKAFRSFHFLLYLAVFGQSQLPVPLDDDEVDMLCDALKSDESFIVEMARFLDTDFMRRLSTALSGMGSDAESGEEHPRGSGAFSSVQPATGGSSAVGAGGGGGGAEWACPHCTFLNPAGSQVCEMCNLPPSS